MIYLDYNATTPLRPEVFEAMKPFLTERWGNPSSSYGFGSQLKGEIEAARRSVARLVNASASEVIFTGSATEANNTALNAALLAQPGKRHIITSAVEHSAILSHCSFLEKQGVQVTRLPVDSEGLLDLAAFAAAFTEETALVSLMWANNETGVIFPVAEIADLCKARGVPFHCDAVQAAGKLPIDFKTIPVDYLSLSAHKIGGPKGIGALIVRKNAPFVPYLHGGHQERARRGGTENIPGIMGFGCAADLARSELVNYAKRISVLRDYLETRLLASIPNTERNGNPTQRLPNTSSVTFPGIEAEALLLLLDQVGICASAGSACLADSDEPSHVIKAMKQGLTVSRHMIRFSLGGQLEPSQLDVVVGSVSRAISILKK
jgi:cysteine desulfurase